MGLFGKKKLTPLEADYVKTRLKQAHECEVLVNKTVKPDVFFGRMNFLLDCLLNLSDYEKYDIFHPEKPSKTFKNITSNLEKYVDVFIDRAYANMKEKTSNLKTEKARATNWEKFFDTMVSAFEGANSFWRGDPKSKHYTGALYTKNNIKHLMDLQEQFEASSFKD
ncbi:hypothetical protein [Ruminococcus sp.]|uniref:hypothetical protein n=1 Tax=Ruminococcus sp. TaxID=41978 RepID=UPI0025E9D276|nr:hypothetical protein [Ruminococcus sp.]